ncbi:MAG: YibE/F family protein [Lachnospiraceae bacterium]|nr:YibE/F family protein [Lachnospiraceae bacterium]
MKSKNNIGKILATALFGVLMVGLLIFANYDRPRYTITESTGTEYETAKVLSVEADNTTVDTTTENVKKGSTELKIKILTGRYKGDICFVENYYSAMYNVDVAAGDTVSVRIDTTGKGTYTAAIYNYNRMPLFIGLIVLFALTLILLGGRQGAKAFAGLVYTVICIFFVLLPLSLKGVPCIPLTCVIIFATSAVCFYLIGGWQVKTIGAALGSLCGVLAAAVIGGIAARLGGVTTFQMEEAEALLLMKNNFAIGLRGLFVSGILIAAMGAVMDVAMTIASALDEVHRLNPERSRGELFVSGMNIGRDAMGTMANTLVLAYVGGALNMLVLIYSYGVSFRQLVNTDFVMIELIRAIAGSMGIFLTVPAVSLICSYLYGKKRRA